MLNEEELMNLNQYKYLYKIYIANNTLNCERLKLIYINKNNLVYLDNDILKCIPNSKTCSENNIDYAIFNIYKLWSRCEVSEWYIISKNKLNSKKIKECKDTKTAVIKSKIKNLEKLINSNKYYFDLYSNELNKLYKEVNTLKKELEELGGNKNE